MYVRWRGWVGAREGGESGQEGDGERAGARRGGGAATRGVARDGRGDDYLGEYN